jgi:acetoin utilization deacetylase AcuC-like enzyme
MLAFLSSGTLVNHDTGPHHPERPDRIRIIYRALFQAGFIVEDPFPDFLADPGLSPLGLPRLNEITPAPADESLILLCHPQSHIDRIKRICEFGGGVLDSGDTPVAANAHDMALLSLGCAIGAADAVMTGQSRRAFAAGRPPGHHAEPAHAMGFCLYSNVAIAARYIQKTYGVERVAIVDFDVHHGNGTQACLEDDASVLFISLHQHPSTCYPGSGHEWEIGVGAGRGTTMNLPLDPGGDDDVYLSVMRGKVVPKLDAFKPQVLLLSAGFDAHRDDPLAQMKLSEDGFAQITTLLCEVSNVHCDGRVISVLEGGYNLRALGRSVVRHVGAMI